VVYKSGRRMRRSLIAFALSSVTVAFAACGGGSHRAADRGPSAGYRAFVEAVDGRLTVLCGATNQTDLYEVAVDGLVRRTKDRNGLPVDQFAVAGDRIAVVGSWGIGMNQIATGTIGRGLAVLDPPLADAHVAAIRPNGTVAWAVPAFLRDAKGMDVWVKRPGRRATRVANAPEIWDLSYVHGRLDALVEHSRRYRWVRGIDRPDAVRSWRLNMDGPGRTVMSANGKLAYSTARTPSTVYLLDAHGHTDKRFRTPWVPLAWSPNERRLLVASTETEGELGLMNRRTGSVKSLGKLPCGRVAAATWD
jgi:hypothetical protein